MNKNLSYYDDGSSRSQGLIEKLKLFANNNELEFIKRAKIINEVDKNSFNYSVEEPILRKYGSFFNIDRPWSFSIVQPCIRTGDFSRLKKQADDPWHISMFHMAVVDFEFYPNQNQNNYLQNLSIRRYFSFLVDEIGLDPDRLAVTYFNGGWLNEISQGQIDLKIYFDKDSVTFNTFRELGLKPHQLLLQSSLDTLLLTFPLPIDFYVGYRFEIFYRTKDKQLFEIGTGESISYKRICENGKILDIIPLDAYLTTVAFGLERVIAAKNEFPSLFDCDHIAPLRDRISSKAKHNDTHRVRILTDAVRATHIIVADGGRHENFSTERKKDFRVYLKAIYDNLNSLEIPLEELTSFYKLNATLQPWLEELSTSADVAFNEFQQYLFRKGEKKGCVVY